MKSHGEWLAEYMRNLGCLELYDKRKVEMEFKREKIYLFQGRSKTFYTKWV